MPNIEMFEVDPRKFVLAIGKVKSKTDLRIEERLNSIGLSYGPYSEGKKGRASLKTIVRLREAGIDVSEFMKREDFVNLFGSE